MKMAQNMVKLVSKFALKLFEADAAVVKVMFVSRGTLGDLFNFV